MMEDHEAEMQVVRHDRDKQHDIGLAARRQAELLIAKCENLEAALANSTVKQADAALERDAQKERVQRLEKDNDQLRINLEEFRTGVTQDLKAKLFGMGT